MNQLSLQYNIPQADLSQFSTLPDPARKTVLENLRHMEYIGTAGRALQACKMLAQQYGGHYNRYYNKWREFSKTGNWKCLVDKRYASQLWQTDKIIGLPKDFVQHWHTLCLSYQRKHKSAHRKLQRDLQAWRDGHGNPIPGYQLPPSNEKGCDLPRGWSYGNLIRHLPSDVECAAVRTGRFAAKQLTPGVHTTRVGMYPFQEIQFDDMWHDFEVIVNGHGQRATRRLLEFGAIDVFSTFIFEPGVKPRIQNMDTGKMQSLNEKDFRIYVANMLCNIGYHPDGTVFNLEHGTATIRNDLAQTINLLTGGKVEIRKSGIGGQGAFLGSYAERSKGNFKAKALKEGIGNLLHNELAALPGQVGKDRDSMPASMHGRRKENDLLLALCDLYPALANDLQLGFLTFADAVQSINDVYRRINARHDHKNEGWEEAGLTHKEYRLSPETQHWLPLTNIEHLPDAQRNLVTMALQTQPELRRMRRLSPAEVIEREKAKLIRLPHSVLPDLVGRDLGIVRTVRNGLFEFQDADCGPGIHRYHAKIKDRDGFDDILPNDRELLTFINPFNPDRLIVCDLNGAYLGYAPVWDKPMRADLDAIHRQHGKAEQHYKEALTEVSIQQGHDWIKRTQRNTEAINRATGKKDLNKSDRTRLQHVAEELSQIQEQFDEPVSANPFSSENLLD